jgi:hypothetical protein
MCKTSSLTNREDDVTKYNEKYVSKKILGNPDNWKLKEGKGPPTDTGSIKYMNACKYIDRSDAQGKLHCDYDDKLRINKCRDLKEGESSNVKSLWGSVSNNRPTSGRGGSGGRGGYGGRGGRGGYGGRGGP